MKKLLRSIPFIVSCYHVAVGIISNFVPGIANKRGTGGTNTARYCYSVWMRHLCNLSKFGMEHIPQTIAELGPGDSLGIGLSAMLSGADQYYALDIVEHANNERNLVIFEELLTMFKKRESIPDDNEFPEVKPVLENYSFPSHILTDSLLEQTLNEERINKIRNCLKQLHTNIIVDFDVYVGYIVPWVNYNGKFPNSGLIFSQACLEHVDMLEEAYHVMNKALLPNGFMSHDIDFKSHGVTIKWNGHWAYSDMKWNMIRGKRPYLINREPLATHLMMGEKNGFEVLTVVRTTQNDGISLNKLKKRFGSITKEDFTTSSAFVIMQKNKPTE